MDPFSVNPDTWESLPFVRQEAGPTSCLWFNRCLLIEPFPESALNEEAGKLLLEDYEEYAKHAKLMASIHAQPPKRWEELLCVVVFLYAHPAFAVMHVHEIPQSRLDKGASPGLCCISVTLAYGKFW